MTELVPGANTALSSSEIKITVHLPAGATVDSSALLLGANGKVRGDGDMCFFNQKSVEGGAVSMDVAGQAATYTLKLGGIGDAVEKIVLTATIDGPQTFGELAPFRVEAPGGFTAPIDTAGKTEKALILGEVYKRNGAWKYKSLAQGFNGGLAALATHFGVDIADDPAPAPAAPPPVNTAKPAAPAPAAPPPTPPAGGGGVNLAKVSLTKESASVSLKKDGGRYGKIRVNLNWNQKKSGGLFGLGARGIDLDIGCMIEMANGQLGLVQALGNAWGDFNGPPFVRLLGDDRTGQSTDGEWIEINGDQWQHIRRVLVYTFIYEGVANWQQTDGRVRVLVPDQPEVEVAMNEHGSKERACAIVMLENQGGQIKVNREITFHRSQEPMDRFYGFGFRWSAGRK